MDKGSFRYYVITLGGCLDILQAQMSWQNYPLDVSVDNLAQQTKLQSMAESRLTLLQSKSVFTSQYSFGPPSSHIEQRIAGRAGHHLHLLHLEHHDPDQVLRRTLPEEQGPLPITAV